MSRRHIAPMLTLGGLAALACACTTIPEASGFLSTYDMMDEAKAKGIQGKRFATPKPEKLPKDAPLVIDLVGYAPDADVDNSITAEQRAILLNHFARSLCLDLSKSFAIESEARPQTYRLRAAITGVEATGRAGAAVSTAASLGGGLPIGVRPPVGLGEFIAEMEVIDPNNKQVAGMIWARKANMTNAGPRISRIGDAYEFASAASSDFSDLFETDRARGAIVGMTGINTGKRDEVCEVYGRESRVSTALGFLGIGVSPELTDRSARNAAETAKPPR